MFGKDIGKTIREQQTRIHELEADNERLSRLQLSGPAAAIAMTIEEGLKEWIEREDTCESELDSPVSELAAVYDSAIHKAIEENAGDILSKADTDKQLELINKKLGPEQVAELAAEGLMRLIKENPKIIKQLLDEESIVKSIGKICKNKEQRELLYVKLLQDDRRVEVSPPERYCGDDVIIGSLGLPS